MAQDYSLGGYARVRTSGHPHANSGALSVATTGSNPGQDAFIIDSVNFVIPGFTLSAMMSWSSEEPVTSTPALSLLGSISTRVLSLKGADFGQIVSLDAR